MSDQRQQQVDDEAVILHSELNQYDVILGRGTGPAERAGNRNRAIHDVIIFFSSTQFDFQGNANYRDLVLRRKKEYLNLGAKNFQKKKRIAMEIISAIESMVSLTQFFLRNAPVALTTRSCVMPSKREDVS